jgi:hypothetical protein
MPKPNNSSRQNVYVKKPKVQHQNQAQIVNNPPQIVASLSQAQQQNAATFSATDNKPFRDMYNMRTYYQSQSFDIDTQQAINYYLDPWEEKGSLYNQAQNLNWNMSQGLPLTANQQYIHDGLMDGMHNLGYNANLVRYDHQGFVNKLLADNGINGTVDTLSMNQLQSLVGATYTENKFNSTSYNDFKNASDASAFKSREIQVKYLAPANTPVTPNGVDAISKMSDDQLATLVNSAVNIDMPNFLAELKTQHRILFLPLG